MFKFINVSCPYYLNQFFGFFAEDNNSLRKNSIKLDRPFQNFKSLYFYWSLPFVGPSFWNQVPQTLKKDDNLNTFKHNLEKHFVHQITWFLLTISLLLILLLLLLLLLLFILLIILLILLLPLLLSLLLLFLLLLLLFLLKASFVLSLQKPSCRVSTRNLRQLEEIFFTCFCCRNMKMKKS